MRTVAVYLLLVLGLVSLGSGLYLLGVIYRDRADTPLDAGVFATGIGGFMVLIGVISLVAFELSAVRVWAVYAIAGLLIARPVALWVANRVSDRGAPARRTL